VNVVRTSSLHLVQNMLSVGVAFRDVIGDSLNALFSLLASLVHYLDAWLLRVTTARARQVHREEDHLDPPVTTAKANLPSLDGTHFQQFLDSVSPS
jgi:hypothetical protein